MSIDIGSGFSARPYGDGFIIDHAGGGCGPADLALVAAVREIERLRAAIAAPPEWVLVPVEPTEAMLTALNNYALCTGYIPEGYRAMLAAAPDAPTTQSHPQR